MNPDPRQSEVGFDPVQLIETYQAGVWRYLRAMGCEASLADDLTQEVNLADGDAVKPPGRKQPDRRVQEPGPGAIRIAMNHAFSRHAGELRPTLSPLSRKDLITRNDSVAVERVDLNTLTSRRTIESVLRSTRSTDEWLSDYS